MKLEDLLAQREAFLGAPLRRSCGLHVARLGSGARPLVLLACRRILIDGARKAAARLSSGVELVRRAALRFAHDHGWLDRSSLLPECTRLAGWWQLLLGRG